MTSRFDYVRYDETSQQKQARLKAAATTAFDDAIVEELDLAPGEVTHADRARDALSNVHSEEDAIDALEVAYMWCGKAIRDQQIERNGSAPLQEERGNE